MQIICRIKTESVDIQYNLNAYLTFTGWLGEAIKKLLRMYHWTGLKVPRYLCKNV